MARKAVVDKEVILNMLREGETTGYIAEKFGVSRQAIDLHRKEFINKGLLPDRRAAKTRKSIKETVHYSAKPAQSLGKTTCENEKQIPDEILITRHNVITLDEQIDLMISALGALKRLPALEAEFDELKSKYESALKEIERVKQEEMKRRDQEQRWLLAQRQGETNNTSDKSNETVEN